MTPDGAGASPAFDAGVSGTVTGAGARAASAAGARSARHGRFTAAWDALLELAEDDARLDRALLEALQLRADHQIAELRRISLATVRERFVDPA